MYTHFIKHNKNINLWNSHIYCKIQSELYIDLCIYTLLFLQTQKMLKYKQYIDIRLLFNNIYLMQETIHLRRKRKIKDYSNFKKLFNKKLDDD